MTNLEDFPVIGIMGSRNVTSSDTTALATIDQICRRASGIILSGGAMGVDTFAEQAAKKYGKPFKKEKVESFEWNILGKTSGHVRNELMAVYLKRHNGCAYIFPKHGEKNAGTKNMIKHCERLSVPHKVIWVDA